MGNTIITLTVNDGASVITIVGDYLYVLEQALKAARDGCGFRVVQFTQYPDRSITRIQDYVGHTLVHSEMKGDYDEEA